MHKETDRKTEEGLTGVPGEIIGRMRQSDGFAGEQAAAVAEALIVLGTPEPKEKTHIPVDADGRVLIPSRLAEVFSDRRFIEMLLATQQFNKIILDFFIFDDPSDCEDEEELELLQEKIQEIAQEILDLDTKISKLYVAITKPNEHEDSLFNQVEETQWYQVAFRQLFQLGQIMVCPPDLWPENPPIWSPGTEMILREVATSWAKYGQPFSVYRFAEIQKEDLRNYLLFLEWFVKHEPALPQVNVIELNEQYSEVVKKAHNVVSEV